MPAQARQASAAAPAAADALNGRTVMSLTLGLDDSFVGDLYKGKGAFWIEGDAAGKIIHQYTEKKRDEWTIDLVDPSRNIRLQLDLRANTATYLDAGTRRRVIYDIRSLSTAVLTQPSALRNPPANDGPVSFCWSDSVDRGAGSLPGRAADCPATYANNGAACARGAESVAAPSRPLECPSGYAVSGAGCERPASTKPNPNGRAADCPEGYSNSGTGCFRLSGAAPLGMNSMTCKASETKVEGHCYKACEAGYTNSGSSCVRALSTVGADKMTCKTGYHKDNGKPRCVADCGNGFTSNGETCAREASTLGLDAMSCKAGETRSGARCLVANGSCASGQVQQGGLCYSACGAGFEGVGATCYATGNKAWVACGMGLAKDAKACAAMVFDPLTALKQAAVSVGMLGAAPAPSGAAAKTARLQAIQKKFKDMGEAYAKAKDLPAFKSGLDAWDKAGAGGEGRAGRLPLESMAGAATEDEMLRHAAQLARIAAAGGASAGAGAGAASPYPMCSALVLGK